MWFGWLIDSGVPMRIPVPERFKPRSVLIFIVLVAMAQLFERTDITFALLTSAYITLFAIGYNIGGGLYYLAGAFIFFNGTIAALIGILFKIFLGEPGQTNLLVPNKTMEAYCLGMAAMAFAAALSRRFLPRQGILAGIAAGDSMKQAALGCMILGIGLQFFIGISRLQSNTFVSAIAQVNHFPTMAIILGTSYEIQHSRGKRSSNWIVWVAGLALFFSGMINFSKEGMFGPMLDWLIPAVVLGFDFSRKQIVSGLIVAFLVIHYLVPFSQYGRVFRKEDGGSNIAAALGLLVHPESTRKLYLEQEASQDDHGLPHYFNQPEGIFDREEMLSVDDALINYTDQGNYVGLAPTTGAFINAIPHFIWRDKPDVISGNYYGRELGIVGEEDTTTGISFSLIGDAYHQEGFPGVALIVSFVTFVFFFIGDTLTGDTRKSPWGLLLIALSAHIAPEGLVGGVVYLTTFGAFAVFMIANLAKYVLPVFANLLTGSERTRVRRTLDFRPVVRGSRINPLLRQPDSETPTH